MYTITMNGKDFVKKLLKDGWALVRINGSPCYAEKRHVYIRAYT
jgi:predicted RNA binding protein YcfA (HicA-like mRNA interferase family)